jgi:hypothetical protein
MRPANWISFVTAFALLACGLPEQPMGAQTQPANGNNNASPNGAIHQEVIDCCQRIHTIGQYQDHRSNYQVGHCMNAGQAAVRRGTAAFEEWKTNNCQSDPSLANGGSPGGGSTGGTGSGGSGGGTTPVDPGLVTGTADAGTSSDGGTGGITEPADGGTSGDGGTGGTTGTADAGTSSDAGSMGGTPDAGMPSAGEITGTLYAMGTAPLQPIAGADVIVRRVEAAGAVTVAGATTDSNGQYSVPGLQTNAYIVEFTGGRLEASALQHVEVSADRGIVLDIQARPALDLSAVCSASPHTKMWRIDNPLSSGVLVWWELYGSPHSGAVTAQPGASYFTTPVVSGPNVVRLLVGNRAVDSQSNTAQTCLVDANAATGTQAGPPPATLNGTCVGLRPGCGNQVCYQATDSGRCSEIRYDCCCIDVYDDGVDLWEPGVCNPT